MDVRQKMDVDTDFDNVAPPIARASPLSSIAFFPVDLSTGKVRREENDKKRGYFELKFQDFRFQSLKSVFESSK